MGYSSIAYLARLVIAAFSRRRPGVPDNEMLKRNRKNVKRIFSRIVQRNIFIFA